MDSDLLAGIRTPVFLNGLTQYRLKSFKVPGFLKNPKNISTIDSITIFFNV